MAIIRMKKAAVYLSKSTDNKPLANLFNAILETDKQTNKNKMVGFNENNGNLIPVIHIGKKFETVDVSDLDEGRNFILGNAILNYNSSENTLTITAETVKEV